MAGIVAQKQLPFFIGCPENTPLSAAMTVTKPSKQATVLEYAERDEKRDKNVNCMTLHVLPEVGFDVVHCAHICKLHSTSFLSVNKCIKTEM